jgi:hypothetical protein
MGRRSQIQLGKEYSITSDQIAFIKTLLPLEQAPSKKSSPVINSAEKKKLVDDSLMASHQELLYSPDMRRDNHGLFSLDNQDTNAIWSEAVCTPGSSSGISLSASESAFYNDALVLGANVQHTTQEETSGASKRSASPTLSNDGK